MLSGKGMKLAFLINGQLAKFISKATRMQNINHFPPRKKRSKLTDKEVLQILLEKIKSQLLKKSAQKLVKK